MPPFFEHALRITWLVVLGYWIWGARSAKAIEQQESLAKRLLAYWLPLLIAALLLGPGDWFGHSLLREQFVPRATLVYSGGLLLAIFGAALAIFSRAMLGRNWIATVQLKQGHELITSGPTVLSGTRSIRASCSSSLAMPSWSAIGAACLQLPSCSFRSGESFDSKRHGWPGTSGSPIACTRPARKR